MSLLENKSILNRIDQLRLETDDILLERQKSHIPCVYEMFLEPKNGYYFNGSYYTLVSLEKSKRSNSKIYLSKDIPFSFSNKEDIYIDTLLNLIAKDKIIPFMIFANGMFIKWSDITIVKDNHYNYIIISGLDLIEDKENINFKCILLPCAIRYGENQSVLNLLNESMRFYFDVDGYLTDDISNINTRIEIIDKNITGFVYSEFDSDLIKLETSKQGQITSKDNILFIKDNTFDIDKINDVEDIGHNYFRCISELENYKIYSYTYNKLERSNSLQYNIGNIEKVDDIIEDSIKNNLSNSTINLINNKFNFKYDKNIKFVENIKNSLNYIASYDSRLFDPVYKKNLKIITKSYTGQDLINLKDSDNIVTLLRTRTDKKLDNYIMIFVNGLLYKYHSRVKYTTNKVSFPLVDINGKDKIEILFFFNINNEIGKFTLKENDPIYIDNRFDLSNCYLYCDQLEDPEFDIVSDSNGIQEKIEFTYKDLYNNNYMIKLNNPFYYNKELAISNPNQFRYVHYNAFKDMVGFTLPEEFAYCREKEKYMVFINGRKIDQEFFELITNEDETPIFDLSIYTKIPLYKGSYIDIFYLPFIMDSITTYERNIKTGDIIIDYSDLSYRLNNYAYIYFINGKKICENELINMNRNRVKLKVDPMSNLHLIVYRHVDPIECLTDLFIDSDYDKYINSLTNKEIESIIGGTKYLSNTEEDIYYETITERQLIYEIVRDYYMNGELHICDDAFVYEYNDIIISEDDKDPVDDYIIRLSDASYDDKANLYGAYSREEKEEIIKSLLDDYIVSIIDDSNENITKLKNAITYDGERLVLDKDYAIMLTDIDNSQINSHGNIIEYEVDNYEEDNTHTLSISEFKDGNIELLDNAVIKEEDSDE